MIKLTNPYRNFLREVKDDIISQLKSQNRRATGLLIDSLRVVANQRLEGELRGLFYLEFLQDGVGSKPKGVGRALVNKLILWMKSKNIAPRKLNGQFAKRTETNYKKSAFAIAKSIVESGTKIKRGQPGISIDQAIERNIDKLGQEVANEYIFTFDNQFRLRK